MILEWRDNDFPPEQKLLGVVYDAGVILREDAQFLLAWNPSTFSKYVRRLRQAHSEPLLRGGWLMNRTAYAYFLTEAGVRYVHHMLGIDAKPITMEAQWSHALGLNAILMRYLRKHGFDGVRWFNTREASDELWFLRKLTTHATDADLRATAIRPDASLRTPLGFWWVEFDNATETSRQLWRKFQLYVTNLSELDESFRRVVWVTKNEARRRSMEMIWARMPSNDVNMRFFVEGEEDFRI
ncbi:replication-relaxation family protein [Alicyclobacillus mali]|uniref:Replication-relaxation family protein n=1 Tax=Alicyclobacillus mali (ex Roth et al. 2021) TaxID=1123961 RepID=A0ABS0F0J7_9BACL|nr:replication-relaxation family protein [Alicyclobacillus mali (ex Roth et al. 2021)]MBF8376815.1 replication-relaxation family protein [Alicyclobacillus mali (ex Roth et al. 2021)]